MKKTLPILCSILGGLLICISSGHSDSVWGILLFIAGALLLAVSGFVYPGKDKHSGGKL